MGKDTDQILALEDRTLDPVTIACDVQKNWWVVLLGMITAALLAYVVVSASYEPKYTATATFVVTTKGDSYVQPNLSRSYDMATMFEKILKSDMMEKIICKRLEVDEIDAEITTSVKENTNILELRVTDRSAKRAIDIIRIIMRNYTRISYYSVGNGVLEVLQEPEIPTVPDNILNIKGAMTKAALAAAVLLIFLIGLMNYLSDTIRKEEEVEKRLDAKSLGEIDFEFKYKTLKELRNWKKERKKALIVTSPIAGFQFVEQYRKLAIKVAYQMEKKNQKVLVVTSFAENEGKSTTAANLALSLAENGKKVLLIDGDLRRASQFLIFDKQKEEVGELGEFLQGNTGIGGLIQKTDIKGLQLMAGKNCYASSTELVQKRAMKRLIDACKQMVDYVIIDSPPTGILGDAEILASYADTVMMVVKQNMSLAEDINDSLDRFRAQNIDVLGVMLNGVKKISTGTFYGKYGRYGRYGKYGKYGQYGSYVSKGKE